MSLVPRGGSARLLLALAATIILLDQLTKYLVVARMTPGVPVPVIDGWLQLRLVRNPGAAFSLSTGTTWLFTIISTVVVVWIVRLSRRITRLPWAIALGLLLGGAAGNLIDRLTRAPGFGQGHVVDFIEYLKFPVISFPIFNVADCCVVIGACFIALLGVLEVPLREPDPDPPEPEPDPESDQEPDRSGEQNG